MEPKEVRFPCPACQVLVSIDTKLCGMQARCPNCDEVILIPFESPLEVSSEDWSEDALKDALSAAVRPYREKLLDHQGRLRKVTEDYNSQFERMREVESSSLRLQKELWLLELEREELVAKGQLDKKTKNKKTALEELTKTGLPDATLEAIAHELLKLQRAHSRLQDDHTLYLQKHLPDLREVEALQEQLKKVEAELKETGSKDKGEKEAGAKLQKEIEKQNKAHEKTLESLQAERDTLANKLDELTQQLEEKEQTLATGTEELSKLQKELEVAEATAKDESTQTKKLKDQIAEFEKLSVEHEKLKTDFEQQQQKQAATQTELEELNKALDQSKLENQNENEALNVVKEELAKQLLTAKKFTQEKEDLAKQINTLETSLSETQESNGGYEEKIQGLEAAAKGFEVQINALCELQDKLEGEIKNSNLRLQKKQDQHRELQETHDEVLASEEALKKQVHTLQAELDEAKSGSEENIQLKTDLEGALITNRELQVKLGEQEADFVVLDTALQKAELEVAKFKKTIEAESSTEAQNTKALAEIEKQFETLEAITDRIEDFENKQSSNAENQKVDEDLREKLEAARIKQAESEIALEKQEANSKKAEETIAQLETEVSKIKEEKKLLVTDAENAQALSEKLNQLEFHSEETSKRNESYTKLIEDLESENREMKTRVKELTALKEKLEKEKSEQKAGATPSDADSPGEVTILEMQTEAREAAVLRSRVTRLEIELRNTSKENEQLQNSINTLRENLRVAMGTDRGIKR